MTYGDQLDQVATALARAQANLRDPTPGNIVDHAAAAIARAQIYRALERQVEVLAGGTEVGLVQELHRATINAPRSLPTPPPTTHPAATALRDAADAARLGGDMLATHVSSDGRPLTSDGVAILGGVDRDQSIAALARLARAAHGTDHQLGRWLLRATDEGSQQDIVRSAAVDASDTAHAPDPHARRAAAYTTEPSRLRGLTVPPVPDAQILETVNSPAGVVRAVDAARAWLVQHQRELSAADLRALTRTGTLLTVEVNHLARTTTNADAAEAGSALAARWRRAATAARGLHSLAPPVPGTGPNLLAAGESWLREQLRPDGRWVEPAHLLGGPEAANWRNATTDLAARLPDLSTLVHRGARAAVERGELLEPHGLEHRPGTLVAVPRWARADPAAGNAAELLRATGQLRRHAARFADAAGVTPELGLHEAETRFRANRDAVRDELRRIGSTRPIDPAPALPRQAAEPEAHRTPTRRTDTAQQAIEQQQQQRQAEQQRLDERRQADQQRHTQQAQRRPGPTV